MPVNLLENMGIDTLKHSKYVDSDLGKQSTSLGTVSVLGKTYKGIQVKIKKEGG